MGMFNRYTLQTPESVELEFTLAGIGNRAYASIIDYSLFGLILFIFSVSWAFLYIQLKDILTNTLGIANNIEIWLYSFWLLIYFALYISYFVFFETLWQGQTPGKRYVKIRVICDNGRPVRLQQATLRALLRPCDELLCIGLFFIIFSQKEKRLGDWLAGTIVIQEEHTSNLKKLSPSQKAQVLAKQLQIEADLSRLSPQDFAVIREYVQRREEMMPEARNQLSEQLAERVREIIYLKQIPPDTTPSLFLEAIYWAYQE